MVKRSAPCLLDEFLAQRREQQVQGGNAAAPPAKSLSFCSDLSVADYVMSQGKKVNHPS
jgi:hypothetical protein